MFSRNAVGYTSETRPFEVSPAYVVVSAARDALRDGRDLVLPEGYTPELLDRLFWLLGAYDSPMHVSPRQGYDLCQVALELNRLNSRGGEQFLTDPQRKAISSLIETVKRAERFWGER